jgi:cytidylate kinase
MIKQIKAYLCARKLRRERRALVRELENLFKAQTLIAQREREIMKRAAQIDCESITTKNQLARGW